MVLVFDKKTPENAFKNFKSDNVVSSGQLLVRSFELIGFYSKVLLTVDAQNAFLRDFNLKSIQVGSDNGNVLRLI